MNKILEEISNIGIVPVIAIDDVNDAVPLAKALCEGGIPCAEVTFRTEAAEEAIRLMSEACPEMLVGAGTVLTPEQVDAAVNAGAKFIVSPGLNPKVVKYCVDKQIPITPGCSNPSDVEMAIELGLEVVKFFPAEASGGLPMIKAMSAPYVNMKFMPTGGINPGNLLSYLDFKKIIACGGSWMVKKEDLKNKNYANITKLAREAVDHMLGFSIKHVGINASDDSQANEIADAFGTILPHEKIDGNSSIFMGSEIEIMKSPYLGAHGHLAIATNSVDRAVYYLEKKGIKLRPETVKKDENGKMKVAYLEGEIGGFAVHLVQK